MFCFNAYETYAILCILTATSPLATLELSNPGTMLFLGTGDVGLKRCSGAQQETHEDYVHACWTTWPTYLGCIALLSPGGAASVGRSTDPGLHLVLNATPDRLLRGERGPLQLDREQASCRPRSQIDDLD